MTEILRIEKLNVSYRIPEGIRHVLRDVSLSLEAGRIQAIVGESGCGKSTLVNTLIALLPSNAAVTSGRIILDGEDVTAMNPAQLRKLRLDKIGVVFQDPFSALDPLMTIEKQARETLRIENPMAKGDETAKISQTFRDCGLRHPEEILPKYPHELSGGLRQRVMIAMSLLNDPALLIADEPTTALDVTIQKEILGLLRKQAAERQLAVLFITHSLDVAAEIADGITVFYGGKIVEQGYVSDIFGLPRHPYTQALLKTIPSIHYGKKERQLMPIEGEMFSFTDDILGCSFAPRCPYARAHCFAREPKWRQNGNHGYACFNEEVL